MFGDWVRTGLDKLKAWVSGEAGDDLDYEVILAKYLSFLTPGPFQQAVAAGNVELGNLPARRRLLGPHGLLLFGGSRRRAPARSLGRLKSRYTIAYDG